MRTLLTSVVSVLATDADGTEGAIPADPGEFTVSRTGDISSTIVVLYVLGGTAGNSIDYQLLGGQVTLPAFIDTAVITIQPLDDSLVEGTETVVLTISASAGYTVGSPASATVNIHDDDGSSNPTVSVSVPDAAASETGPDPGTIRVTRTGSLTQALSVNIARSGTASSGVDYTEVGQFILIPANQSTVDIAIAPIDDSVFDPAETAIITVIGGTGYTVGSPASGTVNITDNETPPSTTVTVTVQDASASETGPDAGTIRVTRTGGSLSQPLTVNITVSGTATSGADYSALGSTVVIPANVSSRDVTIGRLESSWDFGNSATSGRTR
jgi:Calx-beta domain